MRKVLQWVGIIGALIVLVAVLALGWFTRDVDGPIPAELPESGLDSVQSFIGAAHVPRPIAGAPIADHPFLAPAGRNSMHNDSYQSDSYTWGGPLGNNTRVASALFHPLVGNCVAAVTDNAGRLISTCVTPFGVTLVARDPRTLAILARKKITYWLPTGSKFGGGVYFHLDHEGRVLLASNEPAIEIWELQGQGGSLNWHKQNSIGLGGALNAVRKEEHRVIDVQPDWQGHYWFITRGGVVGVAARDGSQVSAIALPGEGIDNAFAVNANGVFVASNHAMYRFSRSAAGHPQIDWRETYDRGSAPKPGTMGHGTGTTPTLLGEEFVAITDNANGRINVVVFRQRPAAGAKALFCQVPVFEPDRGASENSLVALQDGFVVENNFGYQGPFENISAAPGLAKVAIDVAAGGCGVAWENKTLSAPSSVPKVSLPAGLIYVYTRDQSNPDDMHAWYFTAVDAHSGELVFKVLTGVGRKFNNHYGSISITADGSAYIGTMGGVVRVWDEQ